ncbi:MAG: tetratricopeptide repeat protein, partial [Thermodesulfobacteriota bacterium]
AQFALFRIGLAYISQEEYGQALRTMTDLLDKYPKGSLAPEAQEVLNRALLAEITSLYKQQRYVSLIALYNDNKKYISDENWPLVRHYLALAYAGLEMYKESVGLLEANKGLTDFEDERLLTLGRGYYHLGRYQDAADALEQFLTTFPEHEKAAQALVDLARAEQALGQEDQAIEHLRQAAAKDPTVDKDGRIQGLLGQLYLKKGDFAAAAEAMRLSLETLGGREEAKADIFVTYASLAQAYVNLGQSEDALAALAAAKNFMPGQPFPETLYLMADAYKKLGRTEEYKATLEMILGSPGEFWPGVAQQELKIMETEERTGRLLGAPAGLKVTEHAAQASSGEYGPPRPGLQPVQ